MSDLFVIKPRLYSCFAPPHQRTYLGAHVNPVMVGAPALSSARYASDSRGPSSEETSSLMLASVRHDRSNMPETLGGGGGEGSGDGDVLPLTTSPNMTSEKCPTRQSCRGGRTAVRLPRLQVTPSPAPGRLFLFRAQADSS